MTTHQFVSMPGSAAQRLPKAPALVRMLIERVRGLVGFAVLLCGYALLLEALLGYLLSDNSLRRMDFVLSGGGIGLGLVIAGAVVMVVDWIDALPEAGQDPAAEALISRLQELAETTQAAGSRYPAPGRSRDNVATPARRRAVLASTASYHRLDCRLAKADFEEISLAVARQRNLSPCKLCRPADD